ncbi:MAG TPA: 23S rRNA (guanosine(2251)-2'-O)-methyltransferase RlmB [Candidatus Binatia bacterium]|jgi:23S rRNA (guanosine2251-2'-O)-methyltransferase
MDKTSYFLFGINPVLEKLRASPHEIFEILIAQGSSGSAFRGIDTQARHLGIPVQYLPVDSLYRLANGQRHQGVVAKVAAFSYLLFDELLKAIAGVSGLVWVLVLDGLTDPRNFGALLRTAECVGIHDVLIPKDRAVAVTPIVVKASAGAVHHINIYRATNLRRAIARLKELGFWIVGLDPKAPEAIYDRVYPERLGIVLGGEGGGIRPLVLRQCDYLVSIPMRGNVASLNVAVAGGVFLYELVRQSRSH